MSCQPYIQQFIQRFILLSIIAATLLHCGRPQEPSLQTISTQEATDAQEIGVTQYELECKNTVKLQEDYFGEPVTNPNKLPPLPDTLQIINLPLKLHECENLNDSEAKFKPKFQNNKMQGLVFIIDCGAKIVFFRTRDYQVREVSRIAPDGAISASILYTTRLDTDLKGNKNCWVRLLGSAQGHVNCGQKPNHPDMQIQLNWSVDTKSEWVIEKPWPGQEDLRNGTQCILDENTCELSNTGSIQCL